MAYTLRSELQAAGHLVVSPVRRRLGRSVPRPEDSQQLHQCLDNSCSNSVEGPDFRLKVPRASSSIWDSGLGHLVPRPGDSTQVRCLIQRRPPESPEFKMLRRQSQEHQEQLLAVRSESRIVEEKPLVESILRFNLARAKRRDEERSQNTRFHDRYFIHKTPALNLSRVGEHSGAMNVRRPNLALRGVVRSNLPTLEGVPGLGMLNETTWKAVGGVPNKTRILHPSSKLHPTYRTQQVEKMLDDEHAGEIMDTLRARGNTQSPTRRFVDAGQGSNAEILWVKRTKHAQEKQAAREEVLTAKLFVYDRHAHAKRLERVQGAGTWASGIYCNDGETFAFSIISCYPR